MKSRPIISASRAPRFAAIAANPSVICISTLKHIRGLDALAQALSPEERIRARGFLKTKDQARFILGRTLIRTICAAWYGVPPNALNVRITPTGKPFIDNNGYGLCGTKSIHFNISHSEDCVLFASSIAGPVGTDI